MVSSVVRKSMPTLLACRCQDCTTGGQHGCCLGNRLGGPLSTPGSGVYRSDLRNVSACSHRLGAVPQQTDRHQSGVHDRNVAAGPRGQALDGLRTVVLPLGLDPAGGQPSAAGRGGCALDPKPRASAGGGSGHRRHDLWPLRQACGLRGLLQGCLGVQHAQDRSALVAQLGDRGGDAAAEALAQLGDRAAGVVHAVSQAAGLQPARPVPHAPADRRGDDPPDARRFAGLAAAGGGRRAVCHAGGGRSCYRAGKIGQ